MLNKGEWNKNYKCNQDDSCLYKTTLRWYNNNFVIIFDPFLIN